MSIIKDRALANINRLFKDTDTSQLSKLASKVSLSTQDITKLELDAIVNAANNSLLGGGGVDGAIHRAAGPDYSPNAEHLVADAKITKGYNLPSGHVIATVGPIAPPEQPEVLASCYNVVLNTGVYGFNKERAANVALTTTRQFLESNDGASVDQVVFCLFGPEDIELYRAVIQTPASNLPVKSNPTISLAG
ncbi:hypothetical protein BCR42DRAFT_441336 [Absidia repens]|uniref:Macro domain-containing protein n=1 Tax=Absidia repens TaxID=90262 RepID=A0A1X2I6B3_9FUNG|nr:hypothetical protein BCR42DRAFT_441336 [Absidia repens]